MRFTRCVIGRDIKSFFVSVFMFIPILVLVVILLDTAGLNAMLRLLEWVPFHEIIPPIPLAMFITCIIVPIVIVLFYGWKYNSSVKNKAKT